MMRNNGRTDLERFLRKLMSELGLGFQCYYKNRAQNSRRRGIAGHWSIDIWDQRPGHYAKATKDDVAWWDYQLHRVDRSKVRQWKGNYLAYNGSPTQKWYNNQCTDIIFTISGPEYETGVGHKDEFLSWLLFGKDNENGLFAKLAENFGLSFGTKGATNLNSLIVGRSIIEPDAKSLDAINEEYKTLRVRYTQKQKI